MKIEHLAIIFMLIILPIDIVLGIYLDAQIDTIRNQALYDSRLVDCVYDAMRVYQSNSIVDTENDIVTSKMENIEASAASFLSSLQSSFGLSGYKATVMQEYVPAVVYGMYDGYYIYSKFNNTLSQTVVDPNIDNSFKDGVTYEGIKSYVFYSCRYVRERTSGDNDDIVITFTLDNYVTIQGLIHGHYIYDAGYLIDGIKKENDNKYVYNGVAFESSSPEVYSNDFLFDDEANYKEYSYTKINGKKYYFEDCNTEDTNDDYIFHILDGVKVVQVRNSNNPATFSKYKNAIKYNKDAYLYYKEAYEFTNRVRKTYKSVRVGNNEDGSSKDKVIVENYGLGDLRASDAVYSDGTSGNIKAFGKGLIFEKEKKEDDYITESQSGINIQNSNSSFNQHRKAVIRYSIETNLSAAIAGFSAYSDQLEFAMPKISEENWDIIENNCSVIGFLQGLDIGTKKYNGYAVCANTLSTDYVSENAIYIVDTVDTNDKIYHRANATDINTSNSLTGELNLDFERYYMKLKLSGTEMTYYYYPKVYKDSDGKLNLYTASYTSIVSQTAVKRNMEDMYRYMRKTDLDDKIKKAYYIALARERYGSFKVKNDINYEYYLQNY